jgi:hypothetical protein
MAPHNMAYDKSSRTYIRSSSFAPRFLQPDASLYLSKLRSVADGIVDSADTWIGKFPSFDCAPTPARGVDAKTLRSMVAAMRRSEAIEIKYQSMSQPEPGWRWVAPHAIGFDGYRWHARALCLNDSSFKDFLFRGFSKPAIPSRARRAQRPTPIGMKSLRLKSGRTLNFLKPNRKS